MAQFGPQNIPFSQKSEKAADLKHLFSEIEKIKTALNSHHLFTIPGELQPKYKNNKKQDLCLKDATQIDLLKLNHVTFLIQGADDFCTLPAEFMNEIMKPFKGYQSCFNELQSALNQTEKWGESSKEVVRNELLKLDGQWLNLEMTRNLLIFRINEGPLKIKNHGKKAKIQDNGLDAIPSQAELIQDFIEYSKFLFLNENISTKQIKQTEHSDTEFQRFFKYLLMAYDNQIISGMVFYDQLRQERAKIFVEEFGGVSAIKEMIQSNKKALFGPMNSHSLKEGLKAAVKEIDHFKRQTHNILRVDSSHLKLLLELSNNLIKGRALKLAKGSEILEPTKGPKIKYA